MSTSTSPVLVSGSNSSSTTELLEISGLLPVYEWKNAAGEVRRGVRLHSVNLLADDPAKRPVFGGLAEEFTDPLTGEVRGARGERNAVGLNIYGDFAVAVGGAVLGAINPEDGRLFDRKRDAIFLAFRDADAPGAVSVYRREDGEIAGLAAGEQQFSGLVRIRWAAPAGEGHYVAAVEE